MNLEDKVYKKLLDVPKGYVTTYGDLAKAVGLKNGQRIIGKIMNKNPYPVLIPCHRVVMSTGKIGGYAYGENVKTKMLNDEGIEIVNGIIENFDKKLFNFNIEMITSQNKKINYNYGDNEDIKPLCDIQKNTVIKSGFRRETYNHLVLNVKKLISSSYNLDNG